MRLGERIGLAARELVALVGGGGKSTLLFWLGHELVGGDKHVVLTTTTKMGRDQLEGDLRICGTIDCAAQPAPQPIMLVTGGDSHKITGPPPEDLDRLFADGTLDYLIVEADGAHGRPLKAPADHEPVVPSTSTTVVIAVGVDAVGRRLDEASHRVEQAMAFSGLAADHVLTAADCATILIHPGGALRVVPEDARVVVAITKVGSPEQRGVADEIAGLVGEHPRIDRAVLVPAPRENALWVG